MLSTRRVSVETSIEVVSDRSPMRRPSCSRSAASTRQICKVAPSGRTSSLKAVAMRAPARFSR